MYKHIALFVLLIGWTGCSTVVDVWPLGGSDTYEGAYAWGFEVNSFTPCPEHKSDPAEQWWVIASESRNDVFEDLLDRYHESVSNDYQRAYVRLKGHPGKRGSYGHMGAYTREFDLREVLEVRPLGPNDCFPPDAQ